MNGTKEDAKTLSAYLDTLQSKVYEAHKTLIEGNELVTADAIKNKLTDVSERPQLLMEIFNEHNIQMETLVEYEEYAAGTLTHFKTSYTHVLDFIKSKYYLKNIDIKK